MFTGTLSQWQKEKRYLPEAFDRAIAFFLHNGNALSEAGAYPIEGDDIFVNIQKGFTKPAQDRRFELHKRYIDIQLILEGVERQDYSTPFPAETPEEDRIASDDVAFYPTPENAQSVLMKEGQYTIYFPGELHAPNLCADEPSYVRKAIFKIREDVLFK